MLTSDLAKALANDKRLQILRWLQQPLAHFSHQRFGHPLKDGVCGLLIARKLKISQPTATQHLQVLARAGLIRGKRLKQWTLYKRDEKRIAQVKRILHSGW